MDTQADPVSSHWLGMIWRRKMSSALIHTYGGRWETGLSAPATAACTFTPYPGRGLCHPPRWSGRSAPSQRAAVPSRARAPHRGTRGCWIWNSLVAQLARRYPRDFTLITRTARARASYPSCVTVYPRESRSRRVRCLARHSLSTRRSFTKAGWRRRVADPIRLHWNSFAAHTLTHVLPPVSTFRFAHLCRERSQLLHSRSYPRRFTLITRTTPCSRQLP